MKRGLVAAWAALTVIAVGCGSGMPTNGPGGYIEISFDGARCTAPPETLPAGGTAFVLTNTSAHDDAWLFVGSLTDGNAYQDLVDAQDAAGGPPNSPPTHMEWFPHEIASFDPADRPDIDVTPNQTVSAFVLTPGLDALGVATSPPDPLMWLCGPVEVIDA